MAKASSKAEKAKIGRPSKFDPAFVEQARKLALLRATDEEMADFWDISVPTLHAWRKAHPEFLKATKEGKLIADAEIAESLFHRAKGYSHPAVKIFNDRETGVTQVPYIEHYPPDTTAASLWLRNRQPDKWRDKVEVDQNHSIDGDAFSSPLELARGIAFVLALGQREAEANPAAPAAPPMKH